MTDPLSAASGAIGIISFGLQIAQTLVKYCSECKDFNKDITLFKSKAESLSLILQQLDNKLRPYESKNGSLPTSVVNVIRNCESSLQTLDEELEKHGKNTVFKRLAYPFVKGSLTTKNTMLDSLQNNLTVALQLFNVDTNQRVVELSQTFLNHYSTIMQTFDSQTKIVAVNNNEMHLKLDQIIQQKTLEPEGSMELKPLRDDPFIANSRRGFRNKLAHPFIALEDCAGANDVTVDGRTLFSVSPQLIILTTKLTRKAVTDYLYQTILKYIRHYYREIEDDLEGLSEPKIFVELRKVLQLLAGLYRNVISLFKSAGCTFETCRHHEGRNIFSIIFDGQFPAGIDINEFHDIAESLCDLGVQIDFDMLGSAKSEDFSQRNIEHFISKTQRIDTLGVPEIFVTILMRSEDELERILGLNPNAVNTVLPRGGCTPLHVSHAWPRGVQLLLEAGADANKLNYNCYPPIAYTIRAKCIDSIRILLAHDSALGHKSFPIFPFPKLYKELDILKIVCWDLANRRQRLYELAMSMPQEIRTDISIYLKDDRILDAYAWNVTQFLLDFGISVEPALLPSPWRSNKTVYHTLYMSVEAAEYLYRAGFLDIDVCDEKGWTPSMWLCHRASRSISQDDIALISWYISKGVESTKRHGHFDQTMSHHIARKLGYCIAVSDPSWFLPDSYISTLKSFLLEKVDDNCTCACSQNGCLPITCSLKTPESRNSIDLGRRTFERRPVFIIAWEISWYLEDEVKYSPWISESFFRVLTFEWLDLTHTCNCKDFEVYHSDELLSIDEITEIQEEATTIEQLEELVAEFQESFQTFGGSFNAFLKTQWLPRICEFFDQNDEELDEESMQKIRDIGVIMDDEIA
ncbi:hypothetical protein SBOR_7739 [Sclerotinia borealis F-4128]|uniref:Azaphilone pigments biosynthesis cluster protein L N-terminal domain-containing protein n=1 Tax=Sclerotinia borealis (strain F-4128) TaxID=1432307 RepID=W9CAI7_SCLBF|nr:hypothetical protein SBOR_7739 [Sclerotinia borealis F-4128]